MRKRSGDHTRMSPIFPIAICEMVFAWDEAWPVKNLNNNNCYICGEKTKTIFLVYIRLLFLSSNVPGI